MTYPVFFICCCCYYYIIKKRKEQNCVAFALQFDFDFADPAALPALPAPKFFIDILRFLLYSNISMYANVQRKIVQKPERSYNPQWMTREVLS